MTFKTVYFISRVDCRKHYVISASPLHHLWLRSPIAFCKLDGHEYRSFGFPVFNPSLTA